MLRGAKLERSTPKNRGDHTCDKVSRGRKVRSLLPEHQTHSSLKMKVCCQSVVLEHSHISMCGQTEVHKFAMTLLKRNNKLSPFRLPSTAEFKLFEARKIGGPTRKNFRVQLTGSLSCRWNRHAGEVFAKAYIKKNHGTEFKREDLATSFKTHLRTLKNQYERIQAGPTKTQVDIEHCQMSARRTRRQGVGRLQISYDCADGYRVDCSAERRGSRGIWRVARYRPSPEQVGSRWNERG